VPGDVLIIAGGLTRHGGPDELPDLNDWLGTLPHAHKLLIAGNHDFICEQQPERIPQLLSNATYLCDTTIESAGVVFFGSPYKGHDQHSCGQPPCWPPTTTPLTNGSGINRARCLCA
jgi:hypothetical protein